MDSGDIPKKPFRRFSPYPKRQLTPEEKEAWEWYEQESKRPKITHHNWLFEQWKDKQSN